MILLISVFAGITVGLLNARIKKQAFQAPDLRFTWLAVVAFVPQFFAFYLPVTRDLTPDSLAAICLVTSQILLLIFATLNRKLIGMWLLICGLMLNLVVISINGGFMPISPNTASNLVPAPIVRSMPLNERFGKSKDILILPEETQLEWLADRFLLPKWFSFQVAYSAGDILLAFGAYWMLAYQPLHKERD
ncbi:MAG: DUF5317 domain-containing protein [Anaerolineae bacterium]|nr:DUF5317 domain-containing protein [Anaerolineae bacterium]